MSLRMEFVHLASQPGANRRELCRRFNISPQTGYKWLARYAQEGVEALGDQSRRPLQSPRKSTAELENKIFDLRELDPTWGARKLRAQLRDDPTWTEPLPSASTITEILRRKGLLGAARSKEDEAPGRFEHPAPNHLWQMDFKGHFALLDSRGTRCHPFTVLDDHSRCNLCLLACLDEREETVKGALTDIFRRYGMPHRITADNGSPWGNTNTESLTAIGAWLVQLGVRLTHSTPYHPQTQGKLERFHLTLKVELLQRQSFLSIEDVQRAMDRWRERYNLVRPHEALDLRAPITRYQPSIRSFPEVLPKIEYDSQDEVRRVQLNGDVSFRGQLFRAGKGLAGLPIAVRPTGDEAEWNLWFCHHELGSVRLDGDRSKTGRVTPPKKGAGLLMTS